MEPTADGLVEVTTSESHPSAPVLDEAVAALNGNGHATPATDADAFNLHLLHALQSVRIGDFSARLPGDATGLAGKIADTFNDIIELSDKTAKEVERVSRVPDVRARPLDRHVREALALCVEARAGHLCVFMPPAEIAADYLLLIDAIEATAAELAMPVVIEGYLPPPANAGSARKNS